MAIALVVFLPRNVMLGRYLLATVLTLGTIAVAAGALIDRLGHNVRSALLATTILAVATTAIINAHTWTPNSFVGMATVAIVLSVTTGARAAWICLAVSTLILIGLGVWFVTAGPFPPQDTTDVSLPLNWIRITALFAPATALAVMSISFLVRRLEAALSQNRELLEREREQARREVSNQEAQRLEALGRLAGGIAHDFNNLLLVVMSNAELLSKGPRDDTSELLGEIKEVGTRGTELARTLLTLGKAGTGEVGPVELNATINSSLKVMHRLLPPNQRFEFAADERVQRVRSHAGQIGQVVMNLVVNARDAMPNGGTIRVTTRLEDDGFCSLAVEDSGVGMDDETRRRAFEPYFTTKPLGRGAGLGLSTVHGIVRNQGGRVDLQSTPGKGTCVRVSWPASQASEVSVPVKAPEPEVAKKPVVLVVDDEPLSLKVIIRILTAAGFDTISCANGAEALRLWELNRDRVTLVVSDVLMPGMSGRELHDALEQRAPKLPFLFCTGFANDTLPLDLISKPGRKLIAKPFSSETLMASVKALLTPPA
ncbi:MAG: ATP-binding protein [Archangium sp.]